MRSRPPLPQVARGRTEERMTQNGAVESFDLSGLSAAVRDEARIDANGETSWPLRSVAAAIDELSASGYVILGTDLRDYGADGRFVEVAWSAYRGSPPLGVADVQPARTEALLALDRANREAAGWRDAWVLVTWTSAQSAH
jgi:hypothetical protein